MIQSMEKDELGSVRLVLFLILYQSILSDHLMHELWWIEKRENMITNYTDYTNYTNCTNYTELHGVYTELHRVFSLCFYSV